MKRTPLKRTAMKRNTYLKPKKGSKAKKHHVKEDRDAAQAFHRDVIDRAMSVGGLCERCHCRRPLQAHHMVTRARAKGWPLLHNAAVNGAALCFECHTKVHDRNAEDWKRWRHTLPEGMRRAYQLGLGPAEGAA